MQGADQLVFNYQGQIVKVSKGLWVLLFLSIIRPFKRVNIQGMFIVSAKYKSCPSAKVQKHHNNIHFKFHTFGDFSGLIF